LVELAAGQFAESRQQEFISKRTDIFLHLFVERAGRVGLLARH
jgi:hypothetical protein